MIKRVEEILENEWAMLLDMSSTASWFQTKQAYDFFASLPSVLFPFGCGVYRGNILKGVCIGFVTMENNPVMQFFTRRAIIIGGPCLADDCTDEEVTALMNAQKSTLLSGRDGVGFRPIYIETRNFNDYSKWKGAFEKSGFAYQPHLNFHVDCTDLEKMRERMSENRRRQVRHATGDFNCKIANGGLVNEQVTEQDVREWYAILAELYRTKVRTPLWPAEFFIEAFRQGIGRFMDKNPDIWKVCALCRHCRTVETGREIPERTG